MNCKYFVNTNEYMNAYSKVQNRFSLQRRICRVSAIIVSGLAIIVLCVNNRPVSYPLIAIILLAFVNLMLEILDTKKDKEEQARLILSLHEKCLKCEKMDCDMHGLSEVSLKEQINTFSERGANGRT